MRVDWSSRGVRTVSGRTSRSGLLVECRQQVLRDQRPILARGPMVADWLEVDVELGATALDDRRRPRLTGDEPLGSAGPCRQRGHAAIGEARGPYPAGVVELEIEARREGADVH